MLKFPILSVTEVGKGNSSLSSADNTTAKIIVPPVVAEASKASV